MNLQENYIHLMDGSWMKPTNGFSTKELNDYTEKLLESGVVDQEDSYGALDESGFAILLGYLVEKGFMTENKFKELIKTQSVRTGLLNYKEIHQDLLDIGIKINGD